MKVFCILGGSGIMKSLSPAMHTAVLAREGIRGVYVPFAVAPGRVGEAVAGLRALGIAGANVTVPHKEAVIPHLDALAHEAASIGAVNTIVLEGGVLTGRNTDGTGFLDALAGAGAGVRGARALVLGCGGAARAVLWALREAGAGSVALWGRRPEAARALAERFGAGVAVLSAGENIHADILVNTTSVSSRAESPEMAALAEGLTLSGCAVVHDVNYGRADNIWAALAARSGARFLDGLPMLIHQARRSFALWTGRDVPAPVFFEASQRTPA